jgi:6-phosphogluconolactonase
VGEQLVVSENPYEAAARLAVDAIIARHQARGRVRLAVSGGSGLEAARHAIPALPGEVWRALRLAWVDERCVPFADPASNRGEYYRKGILSEASPPGFELPLWKDGDTFERAVRRAKKALLDEFGDRLDVVLGSVGEDGHVASLFPGRPEKFARGTVTHLADAPKPPPERITLTLELLRTASTTIVVLAGEKKRPVLQRFLAGDTELILNALPNITVVTDLDPGARP